MLLLFFLLLLLLPSSATPASPASASSAGFSLNFFPAGGATAVAQLALSGGASANATASPGAISMASPGAQVQHRSPILFSAQGFSTYFAFALRTASPPPSLAFFLDAPSSASRSPPAPAPALALVFSARRVRLDLAGRTVLQAPCPATANRLHAWIDYNVTSSTLHVRLSGSAARHPSPTPPLLTYPLHLRSGPVLAGFRTSSGNCSLFSWAFRPAPPNPMHSQPLNPADLLTTPPSTSHRVPVDRRRYNTSPWGAAVSLLFAAACGAMLTLFLLFLCYSVAARRPVAPVEYPMHPTGSDVAYHKIVLVGAKDDAAAADLPLPVVTETAGFQ